MKNIAIIMTVKDRQKLTQKCIESIIKANNEYNLIFYITNDGSTDGTEIMLEEEKKKNPQYTFIISNGDGNLYWSGGMILSYGKALENDDIDFYLWVNDDVEFFENFFETLKKDYQDLQEKGSNFILCGCVKDKLTNETTYSGHNVNTKKIYHYQRDKLNPNGVPQECNLISGNCVLISKNVAKQNGNIDSRFTHGLGDWMYGIKFIKSKGKCYTTSDYVGYCSRNGIKGTCFDPSLSIIKRVKILHSIKYHPPKEYKIYLKEFFGNRWIIYFTYQYIRIVITSTSYKLKHLFRSKD